MNKILFLLRRFAYYFYGEKFYKRLNFSWKKKPTRLDIKQIMKIFNYQYWLRKFLVSKISQFFLIKIFLLKKNFIRSIIFISIYKVNHWNKYKKINKNNLQVSGPGSDPKSLQIKNLIVDLNKFIKDFQIKSILDMPCGDFIWMKKIIELNKDLKYTGFDIVGEIIDYNNKKFSSNNIKFLKKDILNEPNFDGHDLIFVRDFFIHIPTDDILKNISILAKSNIRFFATTQYQNNPFNKNIVIGQHRKINLSIEPFNLPKPFMQIIDGNINEGRYLNIYKINQILKK